MIGKHYSKKEIEKLRKLNAEGLSPKEISEYFPTREYVHIKDKLTKMCLKIKPKETNPEELNVMENRLIKTLSKSKHDIIELANMYDVGPKSIQDMLSKLKEKGYNIDLDHETLHIKKEGKLEAAAYKINIKDFYGGKIKFGALADTHLGSKSERLDILNALYDIYAKENIKIVLHGGNYVDGEFYFNKFETKTHGFDEMVEYFLENYPKRKGMQTWFVDGDDHEGWWTQREGLETGRVIQERQKEFGRDDLVYLGYQERDLVFKAPKGKAVLRLMHIGGGSSYAVSYATQKLVESYSGGEKPDVLCVGHLHKQIYHYVRNVHVIQLGCTQDQTRFMRKKKLKADLGGWIIEMNQAPTGEINRFKCEWMPFFNEDFYISKIGVQKDQTPLETRLK